MALPRKYSADEIQEIVDMSPAEFSGMKYLAALLKHYESKTDDDIAVEVQAFYRKKPFFPFKKSD